MCDQNSASTQSIADYLAQLLKDRKQLAAFPNVFLHVERLLDEGKSLWSVALCVWNAISIKTNLQNPNFHKINTTKITCDIAERDLIQHKRSNQVFLLWGRILKLGFSKVYVHAVPAKISTRFHCDFCGNLTWNHICLLPNERRKYDCFANSIESARRCRISLTRLLKSWRRLDHFWSIALNFSLVFFNVYFLIINDCFPFFFQLVK